MIRRIMKKAKRWHLRGGIKPFREPRWQGLGSLGEGEAAGKGRKPPEWHNARLAGILALDTKTMRGCEIKNLHWRDVDLLTRVLLARAKQKRRKKQSQLTTQHFAGRSYSMALSQSTLSFPLVSMNALTPRGR